MKLNTNILEVFNDEFFTWILWLRNSTIALNEGLQILYYITPKDYKCYSIQIFRYYNIDEIIIA